MPNAKNEILEWLQALGWPKRSLFSEGLTATPPHRVRATLSVPQLDVLLSAEAEDWSKSAADVSACEMILAELRSRHSEFLIDFDKLFSDAQAGDALIKLAVYGWDRQLSPSERTCILQRVESDRSLANRREEVGEDQRWAESFGPGVGQKLEATIVEAAIWRRFREAFRSGDVRHVLGEVRAMVGADDEGRRFGPAQDGDDR